MNIDYITVGNRIRHFRLQKRLTQEELAFQVETSAAYISNIESGKKRPSLQKLAQISEVLGVTINDFIYEADDPDTQEQVQEFPPEIQQLLVKNIQNIIQSFIT